MLARVLLLRRRGAVIRSERDYPEELCGDLQLSVCRYGEDHLYRLELYKLVEGSNKGAPLVALFDPQLLRVGPFGFVFRGVERTPAAGELRFAGMVQEWRVQPR